MNQGRAFRVNLFRFLCAGVPTTACQAPQIVPRNSLPPGTPPEAADFPDATYLGLGWGDAEYYPARQPTFDMTLRAVLGPTPEGIRKLAGYLDGTFARDGTKRAASIEQGRNVPN